RARPPLRDAARRGQVRLRRHGDPQARERALGGGRGRLSPGRGTGAGHRAAPRPMQIEWDVPIAMDDGIVLRADVFRPEGAGRCPVVMSHGPYGKGLAFEDGYPDQW